MIAREPARIRIRELGAQGDGIGELDGAPAYVPFTLPGERVRARELGKRRFEAVAWDERSAERVEPPCPHFARCGGCAVQHLSPAAYRAWKQGLIGAALADRGLAAGRINEMVAAEPGERRRAEFSCRRDEPLRLGFMDFTGREVVDVRTCPVLLPELVEAMAPLRAAMAVLAPRGGLVDAQMLASDSGIDLLITAAQAPSVRARAALVELARASNVARVSWRIARGVPETMVLNRAPTLRLGGVPVDLPAGAFVQPTARGETAIIAEVARHAAGARRIVELYAGCGTLGFALAAIAPVRAFEGDKDLCAAFEAAARGAGLSGRIEARQRDLARRPLLASEYERGDVVVFDPPRAGAREACEQLARSRIGAIIAVSCHPASFARDARILVDGGYELAEVTPIDQFLWTPHLELVALLRRR